MPQICIKNLRLSESGTNTHKRQYEKQHDGFLCFDQVAIKSLTMCTALLFKSDSQVLI